MLCFALSVFPASSPTLLSLPLTLNASIKCELLAMTHLSISVSLSPSPTPPPPPLFTLTAPHPIPSPSLPISLEESAPEVSPNPPHPAQTPLPHWLVTPYLGSYKTPLCLSLGLSQAHGPPGICLCICPHPTPPPNSGLLGNREPVLITSVFPALSRA